MIHQEKILLTWTQNTFPFWMTMDSWDISEITLHLNKIQNIENNLIKCYKIGGWQLTPTTRGSDMSLMYLILKMACQVLKNTCGLLRFSQHIFTNILSSIPISKPSKGLSILVWKEHWFMILGKLIGFIFLKFKFAKNAWSNCKWHRRFYNI
jgi:hypothetical protein